MPPAASAGISRTERDDVSFGTAPPRVSGGLRILVTTLRTINLSTSGQSRVGHQTPPPLLQPTPLRANDNDPPAAAQAGQEEGHRDSCRLGPHKSPPPPPETAHRLFMAKWFSAQAPRPEQMTACRSSRRVAGRLAVGWLMRGVVTKHEECYGIDLSRP